MSKASDIATAMAAQLNAAAALDGVEAIVDRQLDIATEIQKRLSLSRGKSAGKGAMITIFYLGFENPDSSAAGTPNVSRNYLVSVYASPVLNTGNTPADDLLESAAGVLHRWEPLEASGIAEISVVSGVARADAEFLIYDLTVKVFSRL
jgi:hypothetical protein